jgi:hypothetical protein
MAKRTEYPISGPLTNNFSTEYNKSSLKMSSGLLCVVDTYKLVDVSKVLADSTRETYETSTNFYQTTPRNIPEDILTLAPVKT